MRNAVRGCIKGPAEPEAGRPIYCNPTPSLLTLRGEDRQEGSGNKTRAEAWNEEHSVFRAHQDL